MIDTVLLRQWVHDPNQGTPHDIEPVVLKTTPGRRLLNVSPLPATGENIVDETT